MTTKVKPEAPKPPPGYHPIPGSKFGGHHREIPGGAWATWYPDVGTGLHPKERFSQAEHRKEHEAYRASREGVRATVDEANSVLAGKRPLHEASSHVRRAVKHLKRRVDEATAPPKEDKVRKGGFADPLLKATTVGGAHPPTGFTPIPGSLLGGWHKKVGAKWHYWYPPDVATHAKAAEHFELPNEATGEFKKLAGASLKGLSSYPQVKEALGERHTWADKLATLRRNKEGLAAPELSVVGDSEGKRFDHVDGLSSADWASKKASIGASGKLTPHGQNFESIDSANHKYRVSAGTQPGTYMVQRADVGNGAKDSVDNVSPHALQAMMSRWKHVGSGATSWTKHTVQDHMSPWHGENEIIAGNAPAFFQKMGASDVKAKLAAAKSAAQVLTTSPDPATAAKATALVKTAQQLETDAGANFAKQSAIQKDYQDALLAKRAANGAPLSLEAVYTFQREWFAQNKDSIVALTASQLAWDNSYAKHVVAMTPPGKVTSDTLEDFWKFSESKAILSGNPDGSMTKGPDGALYGLSWNHGVPDLTPEKAAEWATAYKELYDGTAKATKSTAHQEVNNAILNLTSGNVASVHYPDICFNASLASGGSSHLSGGTAYYAKTLEDFKRASAVLAVLSTRRPPVVPPKPLYRNLAMSTEAFAGLHAGKVVQLSNGSSFANYDATSWGYPSTERPIKVAYKIANPKAGMPLDHLSGFPHEQETAISGSLAIEKIEKEVGGRMVVHCRHLLPGELGEWGLAKAVKPTLMRPKHNAAIRFDEAMSDLDRHGALVKTPAKKKDPITKGGFASQEDSDRASSRAEQQGKRLADPTDRLPAIDDRPGPNTIRRLLAQWRRKVKGSTNAQAVQAAIGKGNYAEARRLMEMDMAADKRVEKSFGPTDGVAAVADWADAVIKGAAGLDGAWLDATLRDRIRDCFRWRMESAVTKTDEQIARTVSDALVAGILGYKDATGADRLSRLLKDDEEAAYKRALKLVPQVRTEFPTEVASSGISANGVPMAVTKLVVPHA